MCWVLSATSNLRQRTEEQRQIRHHRTHDVLPCTAQAAVVASENFTRSDIQPGFPVLAVAEFEVLSEGREKEFPVARATRLMTVLLRRPERGDHILDRHAHAVVRIDEAGGDDAVGADDEGGR